MKFIIEVKPPVKATEEEIVEWVRFETKNISSISTDNPLSDYDLDAVRCERY